MDIFTSLECRLSSPCVIALGCFDGVHLGHRAVIEAARAVADEKKLPLTVLCFEEPPRNFFSPASVPLLTKSDEKRSLIEELRVDTLVCVPFNRDIADMSAENFFSELLVSRLCASHIVCGFNFTFGKGGLGNTSLLDTLCKERGICLSVIPPVSSDGIDISSSVIRSAISDGDVSLTTRLLGRPYSLTAEVVSGKQLARKLGFPTANQLFPVGKAVPKYGVYSVRASLDGNPYIGIANIGMRPTVGGDVLCIETHLLGFSGDLYGKMLTVELMDFIREERKFSSVEELKSQIEKDLLSFSRKRK